MTIRELVSSKTGNILSVTIDITDRAHRLFTPRHITDREKLAQALGSTSKAPIDNCAVDRNLSV